MSAFDLDESAEMCPDRRHDEIARLRARVTEAEEELARVRAALLRLPRYRAQALKLSTSPGVLIEDRIGEAVLFADVLAALEGA